MECGDKLIFLGVLGLNETNGLDMNPDSKIFVAGHRGLVGAALMRTLRAGGYQNILIAAHKDLDLTEQSEVEDYFQKSRPDIVIVAAGRVGGILANQSEPDEFIMENCAIALNVIRAAYSIGVRKLLYLGSSCIYPRMAANPIGEEALLTGQLEETNQWYAIAKIAGIKMCQAFRRRHGCDYLTAMPTNLFGPGDRYDAARSHVLPALIARFHAAKQDGIPSVTCWGSGSPRREFLYVDDLARACLLLLENETVEDLFNVGFGSDTTIKELAEMVKQKVGYEGEIDWDESKPDGTPQKLLDSSRIRALGWRPQVSLGQGIELAYRDFLENNPLACAERNGRLALASC